MSEFDRRLARSMREAAKAQYAEAQVQYENAQKMAQANEALHQRLRERQQPDVKRLDR